MSMFGRGRRSGRGTADAPSLQAPPSVSQEPALRTRSEPLEASRPQRVVLNDRYEVGRLLGTGGMAAVHLARDLLLGREVAVKLFRRDTVAGPDLRLQELEARVVASLNHSALTTLLDAGIETSESAAPQVYLVMEYVRGSNLRQRLKRGRLEVSEACWLGFDLAEGLDYMHQSGFIHRDVKPANILISDVRSARPVVAKLTDFGIAAPIGQPDLSEYTVGTAAYLSPEQVEGHDARPESDIYSLGIVLLEAITGEVAFPGSVEESAFARLERDPIVPATVPARIADLLTRMTARRPEARVAPYRLAIELQQFLVDDLIQRRTLETTRSAPVEPAAPPVGDPAQGVDVTPDPTCDALVRLVARSVGVPKALLIVEDGGRRVAKAQHGWDSPVVLSGLPPADGRRAMPVVDPDVRAAASTALRTRDGHVLGELFVFDRAPRDFGAGERTALEDGAHLLVHEFELRAAARRALLGVRGAA